jgi:hypothetical protein
MGMAYRMDWALEGQSWQPKFRPGPEIWSQRSPGRIPASLSLAARDLLDVGPAKSLQGARNLEAIFLAHRLAATKPCADSLIACTKSRFFPFNLPSPYFILSSTSLLCLIVLHVSVLAIPASSLWIETRVCVIVSVRNYFHHAHRIRLYFSFADAPETFLTSHPSPTPFTTAHTHQNSQS